MSWVVGARPLTLRAYPSQAARDLFGYAVGTLIDKNVRILMPEPFASAHQGYVERYVGSGRSHGAIGLRKGVRGARSLWLVSFCVATDARFDRATSLAT